MSSPKLLRPKLGFMQAMNTLRNIALLTLMGVGLFFLFAKIKATKEHSIVDDLGVSNNIATQPDSIRDEIELNNLVYSIATLNNLESEYIGYEGRKSTQPDYLAILKKWADTTRLVKLTDHGNALVRSMAFQTLKEKNYNGLKEIFKKHLNDKQTYNVHSGCDVESVPVNIAFYRCISPTLASVEVATYKRKLLELYKGTFFEFMIRYS